MSASTAPVSELMKTPIWIGCVGLGLLGTLGCGSGSPESSGRSSEQTPFDKAAAKARAATQAVDLAANKPSSPERAAPAVPVDDYESPFPDRQDFFSAPKHAARAKRRDRDDSAESVVLLGFADLDRPRAVLAIDNVVTPLAGGEEASGVRVISIVPPRAVLQRGRSRWTASIE